MSVSVEMFGGKSLSISRSISSSPKSEEVHIFIKAYSWVNICLIIFIISKIFVIPFDLWFDVQKPRDFDSVKSCVGPGHLYVSKSS